MMERHGWKSGDASNMANSLASAAADDSYRNRTTRRSKALKATAQGVHQLASSLAEGSPNGALMMVSILIK